MKFFNLKFLPFLFLGLLFITACNDDDVEIETPEEVITTVIYELTPANGGDVVTLQYEDLDGDGSGGADVTGGTLQANTTYTGRVTFLNKTETPTEDITLEIEEEDEEHQLFFFSDIDGIVVNYSDVDENGFPTGLTTILTTGDAGTGNITIVLRHEPTKVAANVSSESLSNSAGGEVDIEAVITGVTVQ